ncbi:hypothetical protein GCM10022377_07140 [Zhihengliuella alba]|uniref:TOMM leader peptide-binding protein n=2 Tax=Zhihengliuella alba TaxID=547018 RepID=A0ABP7CYA6_9MICC
MQHPPRRCINPGFSLQLVGDRLLIGGGRTGLELEGVDAADHAYILALARRISRAAPPIPAEPGYPPRERCLELDSLLTPALVPIPARPERTGRRLALAPDVSHWSLAYDQHAGGGLQRRAEAVVVLDGAPRAAQYAADLLLAAGIGTLVVRDTDAVAPPDTLTGLLGPHRVGRPRGSELLRSLASRHPDARLCAEMPDIDPESTTVVLLPSGRRECRPADDPAAAESTGPWLVLPLEHGDAVATVGPLHVPGLTPCLECGDRASARLQAERSALPGLPRPTELELTLASTVGSLAAMHVLMAVDAVNVPATAARIIGVDLATGGLRYDDVSPRPGCLCLAAA